MTRQPIETFLDNMSNVASNLRVTMQLTRVSYRDLFFRIAKRLIGKMVVYIQEEFRLLRIVVTFLEDEIHVRVLKRNDDSRISNNALK